MKCFGITLYISFRRGSRAVLTTYLQEKVNLETFNEVLKKAEESADTGDGDDSSESSSLSGSLLDLSALDSQGVPSEPVPQPETEINPDDLDFMVNFEKLTSESHQVHFFVYPFFVSHQ